MKQFKDMDLPLIPLQKNSKVPIKNCNWREDNIDHLAKLITNETNVGLVLGKKSEIIALDFDIDIDNLHKKIYKIAGKSPVVKKGHKGFTAFYRYNNEKKKQFSKDGEVILDLLADGSYTVIPPSIHSKTNKPYIYLTEKTLRDIDINELPYLPTDFVDRINFLFDSGTSEKEYNILPIDSNEKDNIKEALNFISPDTYDTWITIGMALKGSYGDKAFDIWDEWSSKGSSYDSNIMNTKWESFNKDGLTVASIYKMAIENGHKPDNTLYSIHQADKQIKHWKEHGYEIGNYIGIPEMENPDGCNWHLRKKELTVITGSPNAGKSELLDYFIYKSTLNLNYKTFYVSFEKPMAKHIESFYNRISGKRIDHRSQEEDIKAKEFIKNHLYFYNNLNSNKIENILETCEDLNNKLDLDTIVIDPFGSLVSDFGTSEGSLDHVKKCIQDLSRAAKKLNVHIFLVAHPKAGAMMNNNVLNIKNHTGIGIDLYSISGGASFVNYCDNGILVKREGLKTRIKFAKIREQEFDSLGEFYLQYNKFTRRFDSVENEF